MGQPTMNGKQAGFTYIALLIGIAIASAVLAAVGQVWQTVGQRDREKELLFIGNQFRQAINRYYASNRRYPQRLEDLVVDETNAKTKHYLRKIFVDPMTGLTDWGTVKLPNEQIVGVYSLSENKPIKTTGFRRRDSEFEDKEKYSEWQFMAAIRGTPNKSTLVPPSVKSPPSGWVVRKINR